MRKPEFVSMLKEERIVVVATEGYCGAGLYTTQDSRRYRSRTGGRLRLLMSRCYPWRRHGGVREMGWKQRSL